SEEEARRVIEEVVSNTLPAGRLRIQLGSWWGAGQKWARNRASLTADQREVTLSIVRQLDYSTKHGSFISAVTNQTDSDSLKGLCDHVDFYYTKWKTKIPPDVIVATPHSDVK